jgi:tRNA(Ile)-lysidine synthetase-like protein
VQALDWDRCAGSPSFQGLRLRNWRPGDQYQPLGRSETEKIKTLFQYDRVPLWERRTWPVIACGGDGDNATHPDFIVWSRKFGVASRFAAGPESRKVLIIREVTESKPQSAASLYQSACDNQFRRSGEPERLFCEGIL